MARKVGQIDRIGHDYKVVLPNGPDLDRVPPFLISGSQGSSHCSLWLQQSLWLPWPPRPYYRFDFNFSLVACSAVDLSISASWRTWCSRV